MIQAPSFVSDYLIVHELMHLREMNHSPRFWRHVAAALPNYAEAERWLDEHATICCGRDNALQRAVSRAVQHGVELVSRLGLFRRNRPFARPKPDEAEPGQQRDPDIRRQARAEAPATKASGSDALKNEIGK
jgi:hypothetical protein